jgi:hypothetical protein
VVQFDCHSEQAFFAQRAIWAERACLIFLSALGAPFAPRWLRYLGQDLLLRVSLLRLQTALHAHRIAPGFSLPSKYTGSDFSALR